MLCDLKGLISRLNSNTFTTHAANWGATVGKETILPGYYSTPAAATMTGNVEFDAQGDPDAVFVIKSGAAFALTVGQVTLINGAQAGNVFWLVGAALALATGGPYIGNFLAQTTITVGAGVIVTGRIMTVAGAITVATSSGDVNSVPADTSVKYPMGNLANYQIYNGLGAITGAVGYSIDGSNAIVTDAGIVSGFGSPWDGTFVSAGMVPIEFVVGLYIDNVLIPQSVRKYGIILTTGFPVNMNTACNFTTASANLNLEARIHVTTDRGKVKFYNRSLFAQLI